MRHPQHLLKGRVPLCVVALVGGALVLSLIAAPTSDAGAAPKVTATGIITCANEAGTLTFNPPLSTDGTKREHVTLRLQGSGCTTSGSDLTSGPTGEQILARTTGVNSCSTLGFGNLISAKVNYSGARSSGSPVRIAQTKVLSGSEVITGTTGSAAFVHMPLPHHVTGSFPVAYYSASPRSGIRQDDDLGTLGDPPAPTVSLVSPSSGPIGTNVIINGSGFSGTDPSFTATAVAFGGTAATAFTVDNSSEITAIVPALGVAPVDVTVTTPNGPSEVNPGDVFDSSSTYSFSSYADLSVGLSTSELNAQCSVKGGVRSAPVSGSVGL